MKNFDVFHSCDKVKIDTCTLRTTNIIVAFILIGVRKLCAIIENMLYFSVLACFANIFDVKADTESLKKAFLICANGSARTSRRGIPLDIYSN